ncbi:MAG: FkbM family methyltransferase [Verrucomicrobiales bacterium]
MFKPFYKLARWYLKRHQLTVVPQHEYAYIKALEKTWPAEHHRFKDEVVKEGNLCVRWAGMERLLKRQIPINTIIDVGAANGVSATEMLEYYPHSNFLLIEAEEKHGPTLQALKAKNSKMDYVLAAAGKENGEIFFGGPGHDLYEGKASFQNFPGARKAKMTTIDIEVKQRQLKGPFFIKLDTHGFEIPILEGAVHTLAQTEVLLIEAYNVRFEHDTPLFFHLCQWMEQKGFACADILDLKHRPRDLILWQMDILFLRKDRPEFQDPHWIDETEGRLMARV